MLSVKLWREEWIMNNCRTCKCELPGETIKRVWVFCSIACLDIAEEQNGERVPNFRIIPPINPNHEPLKQVP